MSNIVLTQMTKLASSLGMAGEQADLLMTLKATAFKGQVSDAQMGALLIVANQYGLSPWTKEIYAFPDRNNGIVPVVGLDGWSRIINSHPQFDGMDFQQDDESCTCVIYRKDRSHPVKVTEWMSECKRDGVGPWKSHPKRMLRHKAIIQCARLAFGFTGIFEADEAERIIAAEQPQRIDAESGEIMVFDAASAVVLVERCETIDALQAVWREQGAVAVEAQDKAGHAALKAAVKAKKSQLEAIDVESK